MLFADIEQMMFAQRATVAAHQFIFTGSNTTWTVPEGVTSICACAQQANGDSAAVTLVIGGVTQLRAQNENRIGDGGGDGGSAGLNAWGVKSGGGGGGGYTGYGGTGGASGATSNAVSAGGSNGNPGTGGGGGGGGGGGRDTAGGFASSYPGGSVGISGIGANGTTGVGWIPINPGAISAGGPGSPDSRLGNIGGGADGQRGGALAWKNDIAVTPGQVLTINASGGRIRIISGAGRSYPYLAASVFDPNLAYRYWRINASTTTNGYAVGIFEIELRTVVGGPDVTTSSTPTTGGGTSTVGATAPAVDNNTTTYWQGSFTPPSWIRMDLVTPQMIKEVAILARNLAVSPNTGAPANFTIEASEDGVDFAVAATFTGVTGWSNTVFKTFPL
ncbi:MAG: discoidin domain-containing protein [Comamonadaceae bacterium]|nr:MAG: discoidin domain-containing protein [Comamonadaceae bacterium]